jgi:hypothetical protein
MKTLTTDNYLVEYMKIYLISLNQDRDPLDKSPEDIIFIEGQIHAVRHLLDIHMTGVLL